MPPTFIGLQEHETTPFIAGMEISVGIRNLGSFTGTILLSVPRVTLVLCVPQPGLQCADLVFDEMQRIAAQCEGAELSRFPTLRERIVEVSGLQAVRQQMVDGCVGYFVGKTKVICCSASGQRIELASERDS